MKPEEAIEILEEIKELDDTLYAYSDIYMKALETAISVLKEIQQCREMDRKLREVYGDCEGLLEKAVFLLCDHEGVDVGNPIKARLLTDEDVDRWEAYKSIGTVEECREAAEKQRPKKSKDILKINPVIDGNGAYVDADTTVYLLCPNCEELVGIEENCDNYCRECGQKIGEESEEE